MNRFNKGKITGIIAASLSAVSLMGVGFATWIIGVQKTDGDTSISITADDVKYKSLIVSAAFTNDLVLKETFNKPTGTNNYFTYDGEKGNLTISVTFTFTIGKDYTEDAFNADFNKITFAFATDNTVKNNVETKDVHTRETATSDLTYFDLPNALTDITYAGLQFKQEETTDITLKATLVTTIDFKWGSLFGNTAASVQGNGKSPMTYYNEEIGKVDDANKETYMQNAYKELDAMHKKYTNPADQKLKLKFSLTK